MMTEPGSNREKTKNRSCPACDSTEVSSVLPQKIDRSLLTEFSYASRKPPELMHLELWKCTKCKTLYCPRPDSQTFLAGEYGSAAYDSGEEAVDAAVAYADNLEKVVNLIDVSVLDVGAGDGAFISECQRRGAKKIFGIEPSKAAIDSASKEIQSHLTLGTLDNVSAISEKFDLATLFMTVEHVADPNDAFTSLKYCLSANGRIAIVCHNRLSLVNRLLRTKSPIFDIEHQQIFSKKGIVLLFQRMDMDVEYVRSFKNTYSLQYWIRLLPIPKPFRGFFNYMPLRILQKKLSLNVGNIMIVGRLQS
jgi:SAM-dependent methyltransferase